MCFAYTAVSLCIIRHFGDDACKAYSARLEWYLATSGSDRIGPAQRGRVLESVCQVLHAAASQCRAGLCTAHFEQVDNVDQEMRPFRAEGTGSGLTLGGGCVYHPLSAHVLALLDHFCESCIPKESKCSIIHLK